MSVEKIDFAYIRQEKKNFTTNLNSVLQHLRCPTALGVWVYLSSLPEGWVVNKEHLRKHFDMGRDKLDSVLLYLRENGLIETGQERLSDGKMGNGYIYVRCGYDFENDCNFNDQSYPQKEPFTEKPLTAQPYTAKPGHGKSAPINNINNINNIKSREGSLKNFEPDEKNILLCGQLGLLLAGEMESFNNRHRGERTQYEFERWIRRSHEYRESKRLTTQNQSRSTVPEYGPGHPHWESLHGNNGLMNQGSSHGSEVRGNHSGGNGVQKAESYLART